MEFGNSSELPDFMYDPAARLSTAGWNDDEDGLLTFEGGKTEDFKLDIYLDDVLLEGEKMRACCRLVRHENLEVSACN